MSIKEQLADKKQNLIDLEPALKADDVTEETFKEGEALVAEIEELELKAAKAEKAAEILNSIGNAEETNKDTTEVKNMNDLEMFTKNAKEMTDKKSGVSMHMKSASDVLTSVQIADVDKSIAPQAKRVAVADFISNATISGNAITYFVQGDYEGTPAVTAEGAKKLDPTGTLQAGIPLCPPEGDAGTGMAATNSVAQRTGNISAGTSVFSMVVLEKPLKSVHPEIDVVTTPDGAEVAHSVAQLLKMVQHDDQPFIIGGATVYNQMMPFVNRLYVTWVYRDFEGDTTFPAIDPSCFMQVGDTDLHTDPENNLQYGYAEYALRHQ